MGSLRRKWIWIGACIAILLSLAILALEGLSDFDLADHDLVQLSFSTDGNDLSGTLILPRDVPTPPVALIVHGDGPQDRFSDGGYLPLINHFADSGIAVFTWDKPGVGNSEGDWLSQSMSDRAKEVRAAYAMIAQQPQIDAAGIGFLGFSQAGWVLPGVAGDVAPAFTILAGAAVNWQRQGDYFTQVRLRQEGMEQDEIAAHLATEKARDDVLFASTEPPGDAGLSPDRFLFIQRNRHADATDDIAAMQGPVLALWGADDLNVDPHGNASLYRTHLPDRDTQNVIVIPDATHGLLRTRPFNAQLTQNWSVAVRALFVTLGRRSYAPTALDEMTNWIKNQTRSGL